jgi:FMN reductase
MSRNDAAAPILILGGSLGRQSATAVLARHIAELFAARGVAHELLGAEAFDLPLYNPDLHDERAPEADALIAAFRRARAFVWCSPAYHRSISGSFKNALDFLELMKHDDPPYLGGRLVGLVSASSGPIAAISAITAMEAIAHALRGYVVPATAPIGPTARAVDVATGRVTEARAALKLTQLVDEMCEALGAVR